MKYTPGNKAVRDTEHIIGDENKAIWLQRANVPQEEVAPFIKRFKKQALQKRLFSALSLKSLEGIGSTRQYLQGGFKKPYAGDIDVIMELGVWENTMTQKVDKILQACKDNGIPHVQSFGNVSLFFPVSQRVTPQELAIQLDVMLAPKSPNHAIFRYMKDIRYFSAEPYAPTTDGPSLKWVHTSLLLEKALGADNIVMDNTWLYRLHYIDTFTRKTQKELLTTLADKRSSLKKISKKLTLHEAWAQERMKTWFPHLWEQVTVENKKQLLPGGQAVYEEVSDLITQKHYIADPFAFLAKEYNRTQINTFSDGLQAIASLYEQGKYTEAQLQDLFLPYAQRLADKNKGTTRFPTVETMIHNHFPFIDFTALREKGE